MLKRIMTAVIGIPLVVAVIVLGNPFLKYTIMIASLIGMFEFYRVVKKNHQPMVILGYGATILHYIAFDLVGSHYLIYVTLLVIFSLSLMVIFYPKYKVEDVALTLFPVFYVSLLFSFIVELREMTNGSFWIWLVALSAWGSDTCAYFTGITMGKHKLAPALSPKKTIEGSIGGIVGAGLLGYLYTMVFTQFAMSQLREHTFVIVITVMIAAIISQVGDLAASAIKRFFEQKDYGNILPGHGGILDRCDSFIFVAPIIYVVAQIVQSTM